MKRSNDDKQPPKKKVLMTDHFQSNAKPTLLQWQQSPRGLLHGSYRKELKAKLACFDMDGTLITTKGTHTFPKGEHDWRWLYENIPAYIQKYHEDGFQIVFFTNQLNLVKNNRGGGAPAFKRKVERIVDLLKCPVEVFIAIERDQYRKPDIGMFTYLKQILKLDADMKDSFYVGDAAGRANDHSDADIGFARKSKLKFAVPEDFFGKDVPVFQSL